MYYAKMYIGEGGTMASEAALLGTPSIYTSTIRLGYLNELEKKYDLIYSLNNSNEIIEKVRNLVKTRNIKTIWGIKRNKVLEDKITLTKFIYKHLTETYTNENLNNQNLYSKLRY